MQQKTIQFSGDVSLPAIGQGTWYMGEEVSQRKTEVDALRAGIDLGLTLIDTAEMYAEGGAEKVVGEALSGLRDKVFLVSKVYPWNAGGQKAINACEASYVVSIPIISISTYCTGLAVSLLKRLLRRWKN